MQKFIEKLPFQFPLILILCAVIYILFREYKSLKYQKRFENFSLVSKKDPEISFIDILIQAFWKWLEKCSTLLNKNEFLKICGKKYDKYLLLENTNALSGMNYFLIKIICAIFCFILTVLFLLKDYIYLSIFGGIIACFFGFLVPNIILQMLYIKQKKKREENFYQAILLMNHSFASGKNIIQSLQYVKENLEGPLKKEFQKIEQDLNYGLSMEVVFDRLYERTKIKNVKYLTSILTTINQTGGSISKMFDTMEKNMQTEKQFQTELRYLLAPTLFTVSILISIPPILFLIILLLNPNYFDPFFQTPYGFLTFLSLLFIYIIYIVMITKIKKGGNI